MIANNIDKLGLLSLVQESMKGFPDGIPHLAIPFLQARGIDPEMFLPEQEEEQMAQEGQSEPMQQPISQTAPSPEMNMAAEPMMAQNGYNVREIAPAYGELDDLYNQYPDYEGDEVGGIGGAWRSSGVNNPHMVGNINPESSAWKNLLDNYRTNQLNLASKINLAYGSQQYDTKWEMPKLGIKDKFQNWKRNRIQNRYNRKHAVPSAIVTGKHKQD